MVAAESARFSRPFDLIWVGFNLSLDPNRKLIRVLSFLVHRTHGVPTRKGAITARQFPEAPGPKRTDTSGGDGVARQRGLVGDSQNDEQWSDDLSNSSSR